MYELFEISEMLLYWGSVYGLFILFSSLFVLGLFLSANHRFVENGKEKGLILVPLKDWVNGVLIKMDQIRLLVAIKNWVFLLIGVGALVYLSVKILQTSDLNFIALYSFLISFIFFQKSFEDIGVMFLGCYRCMSTFWVAMPITISGLYFRATYHSVFFWLVPFSFLTTAIISALVTMMYMYYDKCKLSVDDMKLNKELMRMEIENEVREASRQMSTSITN